MKTSTDVEFVFVNESVAETGIIPGIGTPASICCRMVININNKISCLHNVTFMILFFVKNAQDGFQKTVFQ